MNKPPEISLIVAAGRNGVIGNKGKLPWHLPSDLAQFKRRTLNNTIIMGRKTFESIGTPLPSRQNIVLTRGHLTYSGVQTAHTLMEAIELSQGPKIFVIGGAEVYRQAFPLCSEVFLTLVDAAPEGDAVFDMADLWRAGGTWRIAQRWLHGTDEHHRHSYALYHFIRQTV